MIMINRTSRTHIQTKTAKAEASMENFKKLQLSLILRVAVQILKILQIPAVICRILQIPPGSAYSKPKFLSKKLAKVYSQKILQFREVLPNVIFEERLNGKSSEIAVEFNPSAGRANKSNPPNSSVNLPDSPHPTRSLKS
jgi:hypothetical protein